MTTFRSVAVATLSALAITFAFADSGAVLTGTAAYGDWRSDKPGLRRHITVDALPAPYATRSASHGPRVVGRPAGAMLSVPLGFEVAQFASGLSEPRLMRTAPNGDVFVAEMQAGRIRVLRSGPGGAKAASMSVYAEHLALPFGIAFYPPGNDPQWVYVGNTNSVVRFPYRNGDVRARGPAEVVVASLPSGGHATRDIAFSPDGSRMYVSVGSASNAGADLRRKSVAEASAWDKDHGAVGAGWGEETDRADVLSFTPDGKDRTIFATGIRNCVGLAVQPTNGDVWCSTNERDQLGNDLVPDYITRVTRGAFYGWPWYYIGDHQDPRLAGQRPDLAGHITVPDVLLQPHSASLQLTFYEGTQFPASYRGSIFAAEHGSWNRSQRTGYKIIRVILDNGKPTGEYEDFMTGFVIDNNDVWGRPVGVTVAKDGSLLVSEDGNGTVWRISYAGH